MRTNGRLTAGMLATTLLVVACGNQQAGSGPSGGTSPSSGPGTATPSTVVAPTGPTSGTPAGTPSGAGTVAPSRTVPTRTVPTRTVPTPTPSAVPARITTTMLLTGPELAKADPKRNWTATSGRAGTPICGRSSTRGDGVVGALDRHFANDLDADGGHWLTRYRTPAAAAAAYRSIVATITSCKAARPAPTHARKLTENRRIALADATTILRWYDYPLPNDPGSEDGGFPYGVTRKGTVVSVVAFREMGPGIKPANFERIVRSAATRLP